MMISICIPIFQVVVEKLVTELNNQNQSLDVEIILIDDASDLSFREKNSSLKVDKYIQLDKNIGRSKIRNLFLKYAKGNYLLFLDCDGLISNANFLEKYDKTINKGNGDVYYGGRILMEKSVGAHKMLRFKYGIERENLNVKDRTAQPYLSFQTNNFLIKKTIFERFNFDENYNEYGYEDLLFAMELKENAIEIFHINNPIVNNDLESNSLYLRKVTEAVQSLWFMYLNENTRKKIQDIKLVSAYETITSLHLVFLCVFIFRLCSSSLQKALLKGDANLKYLDFYKLGLFIDYSKKHPNLGR